MTGESELDPTQQSSSRFRILSLDGGGIKGTFSAAFLATLEELTGKSMVRHFDLIAGTSTGGIIALALGLGLPAQEVLEFYLEHGPKIFPVTGIKRRALRHWVRSKHRVDALRTAVSEILGDRRLGESQTRLVIPSFDAVSGDIRLFKTAHHPRFKLDYRWRASDVALATSAAPTYFPVFHSSDGSRFVDGGIWANNPAAVAVTEAVGVLGVVPEVIEVLSVGTTTEPLHVPKRFVSAGRLSWLRRPGLKLLMQAQEAGSAGLAHAITEHTRRLVRINETTAPGRFKLDRSAGIDDLKSLGHRAATRAEKEVGPRFLDEPVSAFVPHHHPPSP